MKKISAVFVISLLCFSSFSIFSPETYAQDGLVGYWKFDEGSGSIAVDSSGHGNTGTLYNGPVWVDGIHGKALSFDGASTYVRIEDSSSLDVTTQVTVEAWVYPRAYTSNVGHDAHIISRCNEMGGHVYVLASFANGKVNYDVNPSHTYHSSVATLPLYAWTHLAMTYDGAYVRLYINGEFDSSYAKSSPIYTTSNWLAIGCKRWSGGIYAHFNGIIDDVRIYNRALSRQEIQADMGGQQPSRGDLWIDSVLAVQAITHYAHRDWVDGKATVFRVKIKSTFTSSLSNVFLSYTINSKRYDEGPLSIPSGPLTYTYYTKNLWYPSGIPLGGIAFEIDSGHNVPETNEGNNVKLIYVESTWNPAQFRVLYVPIGFWRSVWGGETDRQISSNDLSSMAYYSSELLKGVFPVNRDEFSYSIGGPVSMVSSGINILGEAMHQQIIEHDIYLDRYRQPEMGGYDRVVAVVPSYNDQGNTWHNKWLRLNAYGRTLWNGNDKVVWVEEGYYSTVAHELGHSYGLQNPAVPGFPEQYCGNLGAGCLDYQYSLFENPLPCMMSAGDAYHLWPVRWICEGHYYDLEYRIQTQKYHDPEVVLISGIIFKNNTIILYPFYHLAEGIADIEFNCTGDYGLQFVDSESHVIMQTSFNITYDPPFNTTSFAFAVPYVENTSRIQVTQNGTVLASRDITPNAPEVSVTSPNGGELFVSGQNATISWQSSDLDGDQMKYSVFYSPDNGMNWVPIVSDTIETTLNWTVANDATDKYLIKVIATDGINTGKDISDASFIVVRHDVAVLDAAASKNIIRGGDVLPFNVTVQNQGNYTETFTLEVYANTTMLHAQNLTLTSGDIITVPFAWNTSGFAEGSYTIKGYIPQVLGEVNTFNNQYVYGIVEIDSTPPTIAVLSPQNKSYYSSYIPLTFETNEPVSWIAYSLNNQPNITITDNTIIDIADGTHQIIVYANDTVGNTGSSQTIHFTINSSHYDPWKSTFIGLGNYPIVDFALYNGRLYVAADNKLYAYDKYSWNIINAPAYVTSLKPYEDKLIVGGQGGLYSFNGTTFNLIFTVQTYIKVLGIFNNTLYAGTFLDKPPTLYYCNGSADNPDNWHADTDFSVIVNFFGPFRSIDSFAEYNGNGYVTSGGTVYCYNETGWSIAKTYDDVYAFLDMQVHNGKLYLATRDQGWRTPYYMGYSGFSGRVIEFDGENWTTVFDHDYWIYSLEVYDNKLYAGTANKIYTYNGTSWEVSFNATEGAYYAISMITYDGKIYVGMGNGYIFADPAPLKAEHETIVVPEFPSTTILAVFTAVTMLAAALTKKNPTKRLD